MTDQDARDYEVAGRLTVLIVGVPFGAHVYAIYNAYRVDDFIWCCTYIPGTILCFMLVVVAVLIDYRKLPTAE